MRGCLQRPHTEVRPSPPSMSRTSSSSPAEPPPHSPRPRAHRLRSAHRSFTPPGASYQCDLCLIPHNVMSPVSTHLVAGVGMSFLVKAEDESTVWTDHALPIHSSLRGCVGAPTLAAHGFGVFLSVDVGSGPVSRINTHDALRSSDELAHVTVSLCAPDSRRGEPPGPRKQEGRKCL